MAFAAKTKKAEPLVAALSLADTIHQARAAAHAFIETKVDEVKAGVGHDLPRESIKQMLNHGVGCSCLVALSLLAADQ